MKGGCRFMTPSKGSPGWPGHTQIRAQISGAAGQNGAHPAAASEGNERAETPVNGVTFRTAMQMRCAEIWTRDGRIWTNRQKIAELGIKVVKPFETQVLPSEFRNQILFTELN
jgi:hypothetical protein